MNYPFTVPIVRRLTTRIAQWHNFDTEFCTNLPRILIYPEVKYDCNWAYFHETPASSPFFFLNDSFIKLHQNGDRRFIRVMKSQTEGRADVVVPQSKQIPSFIIRTSRLTLCRKIITVLRAIQNTQMHSVGRMFEYQTWLCLEELLGLKELSLYGQAWYVEWYLPFIEHLWVIQNVPGGMCQTSGGCSLC